MIIERLELNNYRNYKDLKINLDDHINIFYGDNAQGKTNILESIYMCATANSHKGSKDKEIINFDENEAHIKIFVKKKNIDYRIDMHLRKNHRKGIAINGIPVKKASELFGILNVVFFSPEDLSIIKEGPAKRRKFIDMELCQMDKIYVSNLLGYNKILNERNKVLKEYDFIDSADEILDVLDMQLEAFANEVIKRRERFIEEINNIIFDIHYKITDGKEKVRLVYKPAVNGDYGENLTRNRKNDIRYKSTTVGPHRDDIIFLNGKEDIRVYGSQGQQRTAALSLKLSEIELVRKKTGDKPVLLLDDVLSELDDKRKNHLIDSLSDVQTFVTCTGEDDFIRNRETKDNLYIVKAGTVSERSANTNGQ